MVMVIASEDIIAMFFQVLNEAAVVINLEVTESFIIADDYSDPGAISNYNKGLIENCNSNAIVIGNYTAGGICGSNHGVITGASFSGKIIEEKSAGGIAGYNSGDIVIIKERSSVRESNLAVSR